MRVASSLRSSMLLGGAKSDAADITDIEPLCPRRESRPSIFGYLHSDGLTLLAFAPLRHPRTLSTTKGSSIPAKNAEQNNNIGNLRRDSSMLNWLCPPLPNSSQDNHSPVVIQKVTVVIKARTIPHAFAFWKLMPRKNAINNGIAPI